MSIANHLVVVLGAGASKEYDFPLGADLIDGMRSDLTFRFERYVNTLSAGDQIIFEALKRKYPEPDLVKLNERLKAARELADVLHHYPSVDEAIHFFSDRPEVIEVGKLAIARSIIGAEKNAVRLKFESGSAKVADVGGWMPQLFSMIIGSLTRQDIPAAFQNISFVNFNYDRSLEHYFYHAIQSLGLSAEVAHGILSKVRIHRPYGSLGLLPWQGRDGVAFGDARPDLFKMASNIRTYTERDHSKSMISEIHSDLMNAAVVVFLGFGFHKQNMEMLRVERRNRRTRSFVTAYGIDAANYPVLESVVTRCLASGEPASHQILGLKCGDMLVNRRPSIEFALGL